MQLPASYERDSRLCVKDPPNRVALTRSARAPQSRATTYYLMGTPKALLA